MVTNTTATMELVETREKRDRVGRRITSASRRAELVGAWERSGLTQTGAPYLTLMDVTAPQRAHSLRAVFNALRWLVRAGCAWRMLPNDLPPWWTVQQQTQRWLKAGSNAA